MNWCCICTQSFGLPPVDLSSDYILLFFLMILEHTSSMEHELHTFQMYDEQNKLNHSKMDPESYWTCVSQDTR